MLPTTHTRQATIELVAPDHVEVRFKPGQVLDAAGIAEIMAERKRLCGDRKVGILVIVPEDADLDVSVVNIDHYRINQGAEHVLAMCLVVKSLLGETLSNLYHAYYPPTFRAHVCTQEAEGRAWLVGQLAALREEGQ